MRKYPKRKYTEEQIKWCENYELNTGIEPVMCNFEAGDQTFQEAAQWNVTWFEDFATGALHACDLNFMSIGKDVEP